VDDYAQLVIKEAVAAAKAGQQPRALELLLELVETEPGNELAWLWLSGLLPTLHERIAALETVLRLNPTHLKAQQRLHQLKTQQAALQAEQQTRLADYLQSARQFLAKGEKEQARHLLLKLVEEDEKNETAWWLLSESMDDVVDQMVALENVLVLNPHHTQAKTRLEEKQRLQQDALVLGLYYERQKVWDKAAEAYARAAATTASPAVRREATFRQKAAELELSHPGILTSRSTATWLRLSAGPPMLYGLLVFIHLGLRPLNISIPACLGLLGVLMGSVLIVGVRHIPIHTLWNKLFGPIGLSLPYARFLLWLSGLLLTVIPFVVLFAAAIWRLWQFIISP
jgi:tetratricopeptide (TPR) repeat protein